LFTLSLDQDPYFPQGVIDLRYTISCESVGEKGIRLRTNTKTTQLTCDSTPNRDEWLKAIKRVVFKAQNMGDSVKIAIPYSTIIDVDTSSPMDFTETIEVKVVDSGENLSVDSYFFAYFQDMAAALEQIKDAVAAARRFGSEGYATTGEQVIDTTTSRQQQIQSQTPSPASAPRALPERTQSSPEATTSSSRQSSFRLTSLLRPFHDSTPTTPPAQGQPSTSSSTDDAEGFTHVQKREGSSSFVPITSNSPSSSGEEGEIQTTSPTEIENTPTPPSRGLTYPPSTTASSIQNVSGGNAEAARDVSGLAAWMPNPTSWLRMPKRVFGSGGMMSPDDGKHVQEVYSTIAQSPPTTTTLSTITQELPLRSGNDLGFSILEAPEAPAEMVEKFRTTFAFDEKEKLLGCKFSSTASLC
jgi:sterol 3beta-glucosyltransferase